jgi:hypothetical protein
LKHNETEKHTEKQQSEQTLLPVAQKQPINEQKDEETDMSRFIQIDIIIPGKGTEPGRTGYRAPRIAIFGQKAGTQ